MRKGGERGERQEERERARNFWNSLYIVYEAANFFPEEPFLPVFLKREKNEHWISTRGNVRVGEKRADYGNGGTAVWDKKDVLFFKLETRLNCEISRAIPRT